MGRYARTKLRCFVKSKARACVPVVFVRTRLGQEPIHPLEVPTNDGAFLILGGNLKCAKGFSPEASTSFADRVSIYPHPTSVQVSNVGMATKHRAITFTAHRKLEIIPVCISQQVSSSFTLQGTTARAPKRKYVQSRHALDTLHR